MAPGIIMKLLAALMLAFIWAVYLRKINIFSKITWMQVVIASIIGGVFTMVVIFVDLPEFSGIDKQPVPLQKLVYYVYNVALMEEACKFAALLVTIIIFQRWFREEPNYIIYASIVALGFATVENFIYFYKHGVSLVYMRGMMSTFSHIIGNSIIAGFMVMGLRKHILLAILYSIIGLLVATLIHGFYNFFISLGGKLFFIITLVIFSVQIEIWSTLVNNFLNFSRRINLKKSIDRNTLQRFLLFAFMTAGTVQLFGLLYEEGWPNGIYLHLNLLTEELIITLILIVRITRFKIVPRRWTRIWPLLPVIIRRGKFQRSIIPTSPRFFLRIRGDEFNEYPFTSLIDSEVKLSSLPTKDMDFETDINVKLIEKKFIGPSKEIYYLAEILDFHTIHPQYNSRFVLLRPKNYGKRKYKKQPIVGIIALKGFTDVDNIQSGDCKFIRWVALKKEGEPTPSQRLLDMIK